MRELVIYTDGGSRGNPGSAGCGFVIEDSAGEEICSKGVYLGKCTNNVAEYQGLIKALEEIDKPSECSVKIFCDSQLMERQINGQYKVKSPNIRPCYEKAMGLLDELGGYKIGHVYRENNARADELANQAMDAMEDVGGKVRAACKMKKSAGKKLRLGVLVSGGGRTMTNIQEEIDKGNLNAEIVLVICSRSKIKGFERAKEAGYETVAIRKKDFPDVGQFSEKIAEALRGAKVDLVIQAGWLCLWEIPADYENKVMNIHPALLPSFGGQGMWGHHVHEAVIAKGCKVSGCTVHFCTNEYDKGPIIVQRCCESKDSDDGDSLAARVFGEECKAYPEAIKLFAQGRIKVVDSIVEISAEGRDE